MAASGFTPISLYYSTTASAVPTSGNLANGELALNTADMKLYAKNSAGTVTLLASNAGASGSVTSVAASVPAFLSIAGSPITTSGTLAFTLSGTALPTTSGGTGLTSFTSGGVVYASSSSALATGSALQFDGTNLGLGVTPNAWKANYKVIQLGPYGSGVSSFYTDDSAGTNLATNSYFSSTGELYVTTGGASKYRQIPGGSQAWFYAPSGTAGTAVSFTQAMTLDTSGNFGIGTTSPSRRLDVRAAIGGIHVESTTGTSETFLELKNTGGTYYFGVENSAGTSFGATPYALIDYVAAGRSKQTYIEAIGVVTTITSTGLGIGTTSPAYKLDINKGSAGIVARFGGGGTSGILYSDTTFCAIAESTGSNGINIYGASNYIAFNTNATQRFVFGASGQFGIGTTPSYGTSGQVLTSGGSGAAPTWTTAASGAQAFVAFGSTGGI